MRIPMTSSSSAPSSTKPTGFASFSLRDDSPMSIPSPSPNNNNNNNNNQSEFHRRPPQSDEKEMSKLSKSMPLANRPPKRRSIIESDDETSPKPKSAMGLLAATSNHANKSNNPSSEWVKPRDSASMSHDQRNRNILIAQVQRKTLKSGVVAIPKIKSAQLQNALTLVDDDEDDDTSAGEEELGGSLLSDMTRAMSSLHRGRSNAVKVDREARLQDRQSK